MTLFLRMLTYYYLLVLIQDLKLLSLIQELERGNWRDTLMTPAVILWFNLCSWIHNDLRVALVGPKVDLTYEYKVNIHL